MKKHFWILLACLMLACACALAECAVCGSDGVCDACQDLGYLTLKAYGSDEELKAAFTGNPIENLSVLSSLPGLQNLIAATAAPTPVPTLNGMFINRSVREEPTEEPVATPTPKPEEDEDGSKTFTVEVIIGEDVRRYTFTTEETYMLDALMAERLIEGEEVSWGFNVTIVDGVKANYRRGGEYWSILEYVNGQYTSMLDPLASRKVKNGDRYAFVLTR